MRPPLPDMQRKPCVTLIGMPGAGKSTVGLQLAAMLDYGFIDTDYVLESIYARRLQDVTDAFSREEFLDAECEAIRAVQASNCVIATGGSVIYRPQAMEHLKKLGRIVHLSLPLAGIIERVAINPERGISFGPGQGLEELYHERMELYNRYAEAEFDTSEFMPAECARTIISTLHLDI